MLESARELTSTAVQVKQRFIDVHLTGGREDSFRNPMKLYGRYIELMRELDSTADWPPTDQQMAVHDVLRRRLIEARKRFESFIELDVRQFNELLRQQGVSTTIRDDS